MTWGDWGQKTAGVLGGLQTRVLAGGGQRSLQGFLAAETAQVMPLIVAAVGANDCAVLEDESTTAPTFTMLRPPACRFSHDATFTVPLCWPELVEATAQFLQQIAFQHIFPLLVMNPDSRPFFRLNRTSCGMGNVVSCLIDFAYSLIGKSDSVLQSFESSSKKRRTRRTAC